MGNFCLSLLFDPHPTSIAHVRREFIFKTKGKIRSCHLRVMIRINEHNNIFFLYRSDHGYLFHLTKSIRNVCMNHTNFRSHRNLNNLYSVKCCLKFCRSKKRVQTSPYWQSCLVVVFVCWVFSSLEKTEKVNEKSLLKYSTFPNN